METKDTRSWFAKLDRPLYLADGRKTKHRTQAAITAIVCVVIAAGMPIVLRGAGWIGPIVLGVGSIVFLVFYVRWRRARNRALTGSPTRWPDEDI